MKAAFELFLEQGYNNVSMTDIIRRSGGSLATAYELFENKTGLLRALIESRTALLHKAIGDISTATGPPEESLKAAAREFLGVLQDSGSIAMLRIILAESQRDPNFREYFRTSAPEISARLLSETFRRWNDEGLMDVDDPARAADSFFALLLHKSQMAALCCTPLTMTEAEQENHIDHVVGMIFCRYGRRSSPSAP